MQSSSTTTTTQYTRTVSGGDGLVNKPAAKKGGCCGDACAMAGFEYRADFKDLELDGRHWRELFGGASGGGKKLGAFCCCGPMAFVFFRVLMAALAISILVHTLVYVVTDVGLGFYMIYFTNWVVVVNALYFTLAAVTTLMAVCTEGPEADGTPPFVWLTFLLYGMLLPGSLIGALMYWFVVFDGVFYAVSIEATAVLFAMVVLDVWVNRQPYYYAFHGVAGAVLSMGYLLFTVIYWAAGGEDPNGFPYIYRALNWERPLSAGKLVRARPPAAARRPPRASRPRRPALVADRVVPPAPNAGDADPLHRLPALQHADLVPRVGAPPGADQRQGEAERVTDGGAKG